MSEKLKPSAKHERLPDADSKETRKHIEKLGEKLSSDAEKAKGERDKSKEKHEARKSIEKQALKGKEHRPKTSERKSQKEPVTRGHKKMTYKATMKRVEARLPSYQRAFSKFINNDTVDKVSAVASKTVARPSALLGSGIAAFVGLGLTTYYANRLGFSVPPTMFIVLLGIGWVVGLVAEAVFKSIKKAQRR